jgi:hypothetical protein
MRKFIVLLAIVAALAPVAVSAEDEMINQVGSPRVRVEGGIAFGVKIDNSQAIRARARHGEERPMRYFPFARIQRDQIITLREGLYRPPPKLPDVPIGIKEGGYAYPEPLPTQQERPYVPSYGNEQAGFKPYR